MYRRRSNRVDVRAITVGTRGRKKRRPGTAAGRRGEPDRLTDHRRRLRPATLGDAAELFVLQRCCWVDEALANETLDIGALHESLDDVGARLVEWATWCVRLDRRLVGAVRARRVDTMWEIGRLMVAPDLGGRGLGGWLLRYAEARVPRGVDTIALFTGAGSERNIAMYERAGYRAGSVVAPQGVIGLTKPVGPGADSGSRGASVR